MNVFKRKSFASIVLVFLCFSTAPSVWAFGFYDYSHFKEERNKEMIESLVETVFVQGNADEELIDYFWNGDDYIEHNPSMPNGTQAIKDLYVTNRPENFNYELGGVLAEGDFVATHSRVTGIADKPQIVVDIYKILNGQIVEHWDVVQEDVPVEESVNGNAMFPLEGITGPSYQEQENRRMVIKAMTRLLGRGDVSVVDEYWADGYIQHNPGIVDGKDGLKEFLKLVPEGGIDYKIDFAMAYGNFVFLHAMDSRSVILADIFRIEDGLIKEHWDILQQSVPISETVNGNRMYPIH